MAPLRQIRLQELQQTRQRTLVLMQDFNGVATTPQTVIFVSKVETSLTSESASVTVIRPAACRRAQISLKLNVAPSAQE
jgi:hypothetical protein